MALPIASSWTAALIHSSQPNIVHGVHAQGLWAVGLGSALILAAKQVPVTAQTSLSIVRSTPSVLIR